MRPWNLIAGSEAGADTPSQRRACRDQATRRDIVALSAFISFGYNSGPVGDALVAGKGVIEGLIDARVLVGGPVEGMLLRLLQRGRGPGVPGDLRFDLLDLIAIEQQVGVFHRRGRRGNRAGKNDDLEHEGD